MVICVQKSTNKFLEAQSKPAAGTLIENMVRAGYDRSDLEEKVISASEFAALMSVLPEVRAKNEKEAKRKQDFIDALPSWQQVADAIDGVTTIAGLKVVVKKLARVVYWLARNKVD